MIEEFNKLKHSLPYLYKKDRNKFYEAKEELIERSFCLTDLDKLDLFYTLFSLNIQSIWFEYFKKIFNILERKYKIELLRFVSYNTQNENDIDYIKKLYKEVSNETLTEDELLELCFMDKRFFKPLMHSSLKSFKTVNPNLLFFLIDICLEKLKQPKNKVACLEKVVFFRDLKPEEIDYLSGNGNKALFGKIIDIFINSGHIEKANEMIISHDLMKPYYDLNHGVHYFEIFEDKIDEIKQVDYNIFISIDELINYSKILHSNSNDMEKIYHLVNMLLSTNYNYVNNGKTLSLRECFLFCWNQCNEEEKRFIVEEIFSLGEEICSYGLMINMLTYLSVVKNKTYLYMNERFLKKEDALKKLRERFPSTDSFWTDPKRIEEELKKTIK